MNQARPATPPVVPDARLPALRAGDPAVLQEVLIELLPAVRAWMFRLLGAQADLDDAVQEALAALARALPRFEGRAALATLAHTITVRTAYRFFGRAKDTPLELVPPPATEIDPESRAMAREVLRRLYRGLRRLRDHRRVAFVLCAIEGLTPAEAAEIEGVSATAMRSRLMHARAELARRLRGDPYVAAVLGERAPAGKDAVRP